MFNPLSIPASFELRWKKAEEPMKKCDECKKSKKDKEFNANRSKKDGVK